MIGLYPGIGLSDVDEFRLITTTVTAVSAAVGVSVAIFGEPVEVAAIAATWAVSFLSVPGVRSLARTFASRMPWWGVPTVMLGAGNAGSAMLERLREDEHSSARPVAVLDDDPTLHGTSIHGVPIVGPLDQAERLARAGVRVAVVAMPSRSATELWASCRRMQRTSPRSSSCPNW
ncbi:MAG: hypothetical protein U5K81_02080 [Trueperaceae bacterium]|nr:hypothetical protein [Trueperaceae bacterium]